MRTTIASGVAIFGVAALVGPLIRWITWPSSKAGELMPEATGRFVYDLVLLLWPAQPLAVIEVSTGRLVGAAVAVAANVLIFSLLGAAVGSLSERRSMAQLVYATVCILLVMIALWGAGFSVSHVNWLAVVVAMALYAVPFWMVTHSAVATPRVAAPTV